MTPRSSRSSQLPAPVTAAIDAEDVATRARCNLSLVIRLAEAEQRGDRGGTSPELDGEAWYAIELLLLRVRDDVKQLEQLALRGDAP